MFQQEKFQDIDRLATELRGSKARFPGGFWKIHTLYGALKSPPGDTKANDAQWTEHIARLEKWKQEFPNSITARVALGTAYDGYGWFARGGGYADSVTEDGWRLLAERAHKARQTLEEAEALPEKCPEWFMAMLAVARTEQWEAEQLNTIYARAAAFEPDYYYFYRVQADSLLPKWGGEKGDSARFAAAIADHFGGKKGDLMYYEIANTLNCACDNEHGLNGMSWTRIKSGYAVLGELYGTSISHLNAMASMAFMAGDFEYSRELFNQIGDNWDKDVWLTHDIFATRKHQATIPLIKRGMAEASENAKSSEGQLFTTTLTAEMEKNFHQALMNCVKDIPDFSGPSAFLLMQVTDRGAAREVMFSPFTIPEGCLRPELDKAALPAPPKPDYWVMIKMSDTK
jgi:hypothetical protein